VFKFKNELVKLSSYQIQNLEVNLSKSVELINHLKLKSKQNENETKEISAINVVNSKVEESKVEAKSEISKPHLDSNSMWSFESNKNFNCKQCENGLITNKEKTKDASNCSINSIQVEDTVKEFKCEKTLDSNASCFTNKQTELMEQARILTSTPTHLFHLGSSIILDKKPIDI